MAFIRRFTQQVTVADVQGTETVQFSDANDGTTHTSTTTIGYDTGPGRIPDGSYVQGEVLTYYQRGSTETSGSTPVGDRVGADLGGYVEVSFPPYDASYGDCVDVRIVVEADVEIDTTVDTADWGWALAINTGGAGIDLNLPSSVVGTWYSGSGWYGSGTAEMKINGWHMSGNPWFDVAGLNFVSGTTTYSPANGLWLGPGNSTSKLSYQSLSTLSYSRGWANRVYSSRGIGSFLSSDPSYPDLGITSFNSGSVPGIMGTTVTVRVGFDWLFDPSSPLTYMGSSYPTAPYSFIVNGTATVKVSNIRVTITLEFAGPEQRLTVVKSPTKQGDAVLFNQGNAIQTARTRDSFVHIDDPATLVTFSGSAPLGSWDAAIDRAGNTVVTAVPFVPWLPPHVTTSTIPPPYSYYDVDQAPQIWWIPVTAQSGTANSSSWPTAPGGGTGPGVEQVRMVRTPEGLLYLAGGRGHNPVSLQTGTEEICFLWNPDTHAFVACTGGATRLESESWQTEGSVAFYGDEAWLALSFTDAFYGYPPPGDTVSGLWLLRSPDRKGFAWPSTSVWPNTNAAYGLQVPGAAQPPSVVQVGGGQDLRHPRLVIEATGQALLIAWQGTGTDSPVRIGNLVAWVSRDHLQTWSSSTITTGIPEQQAAVTIYGSSAVVLWLNIDGMLQKARAVSLSSGSWS